MAESLKKYCRHCGSPIAYLHTTKNNKLIPILWDSFEDDEKTSLLMGLEVPMRKGLKEDGSGPLHIPHFHEELRNKKWVFRSKRREKRK